MGTGCIVLFDGRSQLDRLLLFDGRSRGDCRWPPHNRCQWKITLDELYRRMFVGTFQYRKRWSDLSGGPYHVCHPFEEYRHDGDDSNRDWFVIRPFGTNNRRQQYLNRNITDTTGTINGPGEVECSTKWFVGDVSYRIGPINKIKVSRTRQQRIHRDDPTRTWTMDVDAHGRIRKQ